MKSIYWSGTITYVFPKEEISRMTVKNEKKTVVGLGEMLLRLTSPNGIRLRDADSFKANYGGGEANVLISLSHLGHPTRFLTRLPQDDFGSACVDYLKANDVDTSFVVRDDASLGIYFLEEGEGARPSKVVYNRKHSSATLMAPKDFADDAIFKDAALLHISGITLALSASSQQTVLALIKKAKEAGVKISFDFNYRSKMMSIDEAKKIYPLVCQYADIVSASPWDIQTLLGFEPEEKDKDKLFQDACRHFGFSYLFTKNREILSAKVQTLQAFVYTGKKKVSGRKVRFKIFDRIGAGDAFTAGYLHELLQAKPDLAKALDYGISNCVLEQTTFGDQAKFSLEELDEYLKNPEAGEVQR